MHEFQYTTLRSEKSVNNRVKDESFYQKIMMHQAKYLDSAPKEYKLGDHMHVSKLASVKKNLIAESLTAPQASTRPSSLIELLSISSEIKAFTSSIVRLRFVILLSTSSGRWVRKERS